jgi:NitT/TauT family transport system substrate-binding protein
MLSEASFPQPRVDRRRLLGGAFTAPLLAALPVIVRPASAATAKHLVVDCLAVTCSLTLPIACVAKAIANRADKSGAQQFEFEYSKYNGWPEVKESLRAGRTPATFMLGPLVMDLADKRIPIKIVSLGHRSGAVIMVRADSPYQHFEQLTGKRIAIPSRFAVDYLFLRRMLAQELQRTSRSSRWHQPTCQRRCTRTRSMLIAPVSPSARRRSAPAMRGCCG